MKIPKSVRIGGVEYTVKEVEIARLGTNLCWGTIDYGTSTIQLSTMDDTSHQHQCVTLWHEILHGLFEHACVHPEDEEEIVDVLAKGVYQVLQDNGRRLFDIVSEKRAP